MAAKKEKSQKNAVNYVDDVYDISADEGAFDDDIMDNDTDSSFEKNVFFSEGRHARTFSLPLEDVLYSKLLNYEKQGKASIFNKQYCPCPKEGAILVLCEYDIYY